MSKMELRLAGSGGQGVILASVIVADAAARAGWHTAQSQSYGPEARGGACKGEVVISDRPIGFTKVQKPDLLMALTQQALDTYAKELPEGCIVLVDDSVRVSQDLKGCRVVSLPILHTAREKIGKQQTANLVAVGCINDLLRITDADGIRNSALKRIPKGTEHWNIMALEEGERLAADAAKTIWNERGASAS